MARGRKSDQPARSAGEDVNPEPLPSHGLTLQRTVRGQGCDRLRSTLAT